VQRMFSREARGRAAAAQEHAAMVSFATWLAAHQSELSSVAAAVVALTKAHTGAPSRRAAEESLVGAVAKVAEVVATAEAYAATAEATPVHRQYVAALRSVRSYTEVLSRACGADDVEAIRHAQQSIIALNAALVDLQHRSRSWF